MDQQIKKNIELLVKQFNFQQRIVGGIAKEQISNRLDQLRLARENDILIKREVKEDTKGSKGGCRGSKHIQPYLI